VADAEDGMDTGPLTRLVLGLLGELETGPDTLATRPLLAGLALWDADREPLPGRRADVAGRRARPAVGTGRPAWGCSPPSSPSGLPEAGAHGGRGAGLVRAAGRRAAHRNPITSWPTEELWWDAAEEPPSRLVAVRDLDLVDDGAWPAALRVLGHRPGVSGRRCGPPAATRHGGLARHVRLAGRRPHGNWRLPSATGLAALFDVVQRSRCAPPWPTTGCSPRSGSVADPAIADTADAADLLARPRRPARSPPDAALTWAEYAELADAVLAERVDPRRTGHRRSGLRAADGSVLDADRAVLLDRALAGPGLPPAETVAGRLDPDGIRRAGRAVGPAAGLGGRGRRAGRLGLGLGLGRRCEARAQARSVGSGPPWASLPEVVAACAAIGAAVHEGELWRHERL